MTPTTTGENMKKATSQEESKSSARQLVDMVWKHNREATGFSWQRLNWSMGEAVTLAISAGMTFGVNDFTEIFNEYNGHYWFGTDNDHSQGERFYSKAVEMNNLSACQSFEVWKKRPPFIHEGTRLVIGSRFYYQHKDQRYYVTVTSFPDNNQSLTTCAYKPRDNGKRCDECSQWVHTYSKEKVAKRFKITIEELRTLEREIEKAKKAAKAKETETK